MTPKELRELAGRLSYEPSFPFDIMAAVTALRDHADLCEALEAFLTETPERQYMGIIRMENGTYKVGRYYIRMSLDDDKPRLYAAEWVNGDTPAAALLSWWMERKGDA